MQLLLQVRKKIGLKMSEFFLMLNAITYMYGYRLLIVIRLSKSEITTNNNNYYK
jgi:hypothetical protein